MKKIIDNFVVLYDCGLDSFLDSLSSCSSSDLFDICSDLYFVKNYLSDYRKNFIIKYKSLYEFDPLIKSYYVYYCRRYLLLCSFASKCLYHSYFLLKDRYSICFYTSR